MTASTFGRRSEDHMWWCRYRWVKTRLAPALLVIGGFCWNEVWAVIKAAPTAADRQRYDVGLVDQQQLAIQVVEMRGEINQVKASMEGEHQLSEQQRTEILTKLEKLEDQLRAWFVAAAGGPKR